MSSAVYSLLFSTLYNEPSPIGQLGRGAHYSVIQAVQWVRPSDGETLTYPLLQRMGILWDEDHDTRVIDVIEAGYMNRLLHPVLFMGERKACLTVVVRNEFEITEEYIRAWDEVNDRFSKAQGDYWNVEIVHRCDAARRAQVINDDSEVVETYLQNIMNVWKIGLHRHPSQPIEGGMAQSSTIVNFSGT